MPTHKDILIAIIDIMDNVDIWNGAKLEMIEDILMNNADEIYTEEEFNA